MSGRRRHLPKRAVEVGGALRFAESSLVAIANAGGLSSRCRRRDAVDAKGGSGKRAPDMRCREKEP